MSVYKRRKHISWIVIALIWVMAIALADQNNSWIGFVLAGIITFAKLIGFWSGDYEDNDWEKL